MARYKKNINKTIKISIFRKKQEKQLSWIAWSNVMKVRHENNKRFFRGEWTQHWICLSQKYLNLDEISNYFLFSSTFRLALLQFLILSKKKSLDQIVIKNCNSKSNCFIIGSVRWWTVVWQGKVRIRVELLPGF